MSLWKDFCRALESNLTRRHYGLLAEQIDTFAVFLLDEGQTEEVWDTKFDVEPGQPPVPPFPFPQMCIVFPDHVIAFDEPTINEKNELECSMLLYLPRLETDEVIALATVVLPSDAKSYEDIKLHDFRGAFWFSNGEGHIFDDEQPLNAIPTALQTYHDMLQERSEAQRAVQALRSKKSRTEKDEAALAQLQEVLNRYDDLYDKVHHLVEDATEINMELAYNIETTCRLGFGRSLLAINWMNAHFVVEGRGKNLKSFGQATKSKRKKNKIVRRLHERPHYILLSATALGEAWHKAHPGEGHASPIPHLRRGHYRTLIAERYKNRGDRVWVRPHAVGGEVVQWRAGEIFYKVVE